MDELAVIAPNAAEKIRPYYMWNARIAASVFLYWFLKDQQISHVKICILAAYLPVLHIYAC